jgi:ribosomal protein S12 methylthiotransferase
MRFKMISLGCPKNLVDSEEIAHRLECAGHVLADDATCTVINTCSFIAEAAKESIETVLQAAEQGRQQGGRIVVTGCLVERYGERLRELLPEVDLFVGRGAYGGIERIVEKRGFFASVNGHAGHAPATERHVLTALPSAYLKIQEGCDNHCAYCTIPAIRGPLASRDVAAIRDELISLLDAGFREFTVIGQDITSFGRDTGTSLKELLRVLLAMERDFFLRLLYLHPKGIDRELLGLMASDERIIPYLDVPIQHSEDRILQAMGRGYTKADLERLMNEIRDVMPDVVLRTTVMVGFPGETDEEFERLREFISAGQFDNLGAFMYSREEGTPAYRLKPQVKKTVKRERHSAIMEMQREISRQRLSRLKGTTQTVVVEGQEEGHMVGRMLLQAPDVDGIAFIRGECVPGEIKKGEVIRTLDYDVIIQLGGGNGADR